MTFPPLSRGKRLPILLVALLLFVGISAAAQASSQAPSAFAVESDGVPLMFIQNVGQFDAQAQFQLRGRDGALWLASDGLWLTLSNSQSEEARAAAVQLRFEGANPHATIEGVERLQSRVNYLLGSDVAQQHTNVPVWGGVRYHDLYPGIDLELRGSAGQLEPRLIVREGADLSAVRLHVAGAEQLRVQEGALAISTAAGETSFPLLRVLSPDGQPLTQDSAAHVIGSTVVAPFAPPVALDAPTTPLVGGIAYSTFIGGSGDETIRSSALDASGSAYLIGETASINYPTQSGFQPTHAGATDVVITKLSPDGSSLAYSTFLGGTGNDLGYDIAVDTSGRAYVIGYTASTNFPTTSGAYDTTHNGADDVFVSILSADGTALLSSTLLGDVVNNRGFSITVDTDQNVYASGLTEGGGFPTTSGAYDSSHNGGGDMFVTKLTPTLQALTFSTFIGGPGNESGKDLVFDGSGLYIVGETNNNGYPTTPGAYDTTLSGPTDIVVTKLSPNGDDLLYSTFLGGTDREAGNGIAVDSEGKAYVVGSTVSSTYPTTAGAYDTSYNGGMNDIVVTCLNATGSALFYSTFLGGSADDQGIKIVLDWDRTAYITGRTRSTDYPTTPSPSPYDDTFNGADDVVVTQIAGDGASLGYSTYIGGSLNDSPVGIALDRWGAAYITGTTASAGVGPSAVAYPTTPGAYDTSYNGGNSDAFVTKLGASPLAVTLEAFTAEAQADGVRLAWQTASELDTLGFHLYRSTEAAGPGERITPTMIPSQAGGSGQGASYEWLDNNVSQGSTYYYWLEALDTQGGTQRFGPVSATPGAPTAVTLGAVQGRSASPALALALAALGLVALGGLAARRRM